MNVESKFDVANVSCPRCGEYRIAFEATKYLERSISNPRKIAVLSHAIRSRELNSERSLILSETIAAILKEDRLPTPPEQVDNLIFWIGEKMKRSTSPHVRVTAQGSAAIAGALDVSHMFTVNETLVERKLAETNHESGMDTLRLKYSGWERYSELVKRKIDSRTAFMAMPFNGAVPDLVFEAFKNSVAQTGFELRRNIDKQPAGLIDAHLVVQIRNSRFMIADLTDENRGAYWEAGFAEGLGLPVIYTCESGHFSRHETHFDTSHRGTIRWNTSELAPALQVLKDMIRYTLPTEAKMTDD